VQDMPQAHAMTTKRIPYRCMKCRGRNTGTAHESLRKTPKCRHCGHFRFYIDMARLNRTDICRDEACWYHPHRYGSTLCIHHKDYELMTRVHRHGEDEAEVRMEIAMRLPAPVMSASAHCPF
jgi:DNA-directed RNA polymerase subunit RPC12/RpoP